MHTLQNIISILQNYWQKNGCLILQPIDKEVGAGTSHSATFLRSIGPESWYAAYVQPCRRPKDGRYGKNANRLQQYYQFQVVLKPAPNNIQDLYLESLSQLGIDLALHDVRFIEDNWENPTLGAWGVGWEVWIDGMEVTQFTYFQQVGGINCKPILGEITYGLERLAMYLQNIDNVFDIVWQSIDDGGKRQITYGDIFLQNEEQQSKYNFECSDSKWLFTQFDQYETQALSMIDQQLTLPAYELLLSASHTFNLLDARGAIAVTARTAYIARLRNLAKLIANKYYFDREALGFPLLHKNF